MYENGVDTRAFFKIKIGDRQHWAKTELEKKDSEQERLEPKLRRLGRKIDFKTLLGMEQPRIEFLSACDKSIFETAKKISRLAWYRAHLKSFLKEGK